MAMIMIMDEDVDELDRFLQSEGGTFDYAKAAELRKRIELARRGYPEEKPVITS